MIIKETVDRSETLDYIVRVGGDTLGQDVLMVGGGWWSTRESDPVWISARR